MEGGMNSLGQATGFAPLGRVIAAVLIAASVGCTSPANGAADATSGRRCFLPSQVNGLDARDRDAVDVTVGVDHIYRLEIIGACPDFDWSQRIGIRSTGGGSWVCSGLDAELLVPSVTGIQRCPVTVVRRLNEDEIRASRVTRSDGGRSS
jgi:hypothetical protein